MARYSFNERDNCGVGVIVNKYGVPQHDILIKGIAALIKLSHRGAIQSDGRTGDGCGVATQIPDDYFRMIMADEDEFVLSELYGVGNIFFSLAEISIAKQKEIIQEEAAKLGLNELFFRKVPINVSVLGRIAKNSLPHIEQLFVNSVPDCTSSEFELLLYVLRKNIEFRLRELTDFFICSLSNRTIVYKALCLPRILKEFYLDLANPEFKTALCVFHQRFSTNTKPSWRLAQPFRYVAHNGEINTVSANRSWAKSRGFNLLPEKIRTLIHEKALLVSESGSDSFSLDNMLEMLLISGIDFKQALRTLVPPYWHNNHKLEKSLQEWYETVGIGFEPWDGPAGLVFSNGKQVLCSLDRNGLRPLRYSITQDGTVIVASETGILDYPDEDFIVKNRLGAGEMILIDTEAKMVLFDRAIYRQFDLNLTKLNNYQSLTAEYNLETNRILPEKSSIYRKLFQVSNEEMESVIRVMALDGGEATMSMGDDAAIAVLSSVIRPLSDYFRQNFAQVTNPAIDSLREKYVMALDTYIGDKPDLQCVNALNGYKLTSPLVTPELFNRILSEPADWKKIFPLELSYSPQEESLKDAVIRLGKDAKEAVINGYNLIILSDRNISVDKHPLPAVMIVGAIHNLLVNNSLRLNCDIVVETATARDPHHMCVLLGFGATAIYPYLSYALIGELAQSKGIALSKEQLEKNYIAAINKGILKIMSKMGIATVASYRGSQLFEALGLDDDVCELCFTLAPSRIQGKGFTDIAGQIAMLHTEAWDDQKLISEGGSIKYSYHGEYHAFNPDVVTSLQKYVRSGKKEDYQNYAKLVNMRPVTCLRDLLQIKPLKDVVNEEDLLRVDDISEICRRFDSAAMSIGALSAEAHHALATAMNTIGGRSNSGEGGEDPLRYKTERNSKIKQVASGRFGVTPAYLMSAEIIQIKIAQGAKPGEGGQLPGDKVSVEIARLRHATPSVPLISPPPHHDIYSIEDLAQLIFDLKQLNPGAQISVKLVSEPGIGVIACGVAKAQADLITISGYDGGTGAAPVTSVKNVGSPWELGLAETHALLVENNLRHKIRLQVDGGLKTGLDVVKAAILGAETFGFGTAPMVALGCKYLRICHLNNCATGIATQNEVLRQGHFKGLPEMVINFFTGVAKEVQELMAKLGVSELVELIGRTDLLEPLENIAKTNIDLSEMLRLSGVTSNYPRYYSEANVNHDRGVLNQRIYADCMEAVYNLDELEKSYTIYNTDRSVGATLAGEIAKNYGNNGMEKPLKLIFDGVAGQSFGVWATRGMELYLHGEANDYVGKGLAGGKLVIKQNNRNLSGNVTVMGNTCLFGATSGFLFANGSAGDRFAARNSGVIAVIEGVASNGCEYMTGGVVTILGDIDANFGAGMTGGVCYVWSKKGKINENLNHDSVEAVTLDSVGETYQTHHDYLYKLVQTHHRETHSAQAAQFLADFENNILELVMVKPKAMSFEQLVKFLQHPEV